MPTTQPPNSSFKSLTSVDSTKLTSRLRRTCGLSGPDIAHISQFLLNAESDVKNYQSEIRKRHAEIVSFQNRISGLQRHMEACRSLLAPIRKLPLEVLTKVFIEFCAEETTMGKVFGCPPLTLSHVSGGWRELALSTPQLWSTIDIDFDHTKSRDSDEIGWSQLVIEILIRSKKYSLTLSIHSGDTIENLQDADIRLIQTLAAQSERWRDVTLELDADSLLDESLSVIRGQLPMLESLTLKNLWEYPDFPEIDIFDNAPKLISFSAGSVSALDPTLPWNQLTNLQLTDCSFLEVLQLMEVCPRLHELTYVGDFYQNEAHPDYHPEQIRSFNHVNSFTIKTTSVNDTFMLRSMFAWLSFPPLETLSISADQMMPAWDWEEIPDTIALFISNSGCRLTTLSLKHMQLSDVDILSILEACPHLRKLVLHGWKYEEQHKVNPAVVVNAGVTTELAAKLAVNHAQYNPASTPIVPKLEELEFGFHYQSALFSGRRLVAALCRLVESRWLPDKEFADDIGVTCLESVSFVVMGSDCKAEYFTTPMNLREVGLRLEVSGALS
ncbi:hypothetical protein D9758_014504 [Tetrapyrgos nigripes]|uniref:F-box domain-containing protein n=1 Tax=Tetrapyrgos nigripes TaxID=182062 RepID=A0A8H5CUX2_9AGAR|nr:hypothetical protein D9758_014504 [Tetrapyrgos nigripes]